MNAVGLLLSPRSVTASDVNTMGFERVKNREALRRSAALRAARRSPKAAAMLQSRVSLVGNAEWRITNFKQVAHAMSKWAKV